MSKSLDEHSRVNWTFSAHRRAHRDVTHQQNKRVNFITDRGLEERGHFFGSYKENLPTWNGKNVIQLLAELNRVGGRILDVGFGEGLFIDQVSTTYPNIICDGFTTYPYHFDQLHDGKRVNLSITDIQKFHGRDIYKLIVCEHSLEYVLNPLLALKNIWNALKVGGIALIDPVQMRFVSQAQQKLFMDLLANDYGFNFKRVINWTRGKEYETDWKLSFQKTDQPLKFPVHLSKVADISTANLKQYQVVYKLKTTIL